MAANEVGAILKRKIVLTTQPSQLCVNSSTLAYKKANLFVTTMRVTFDWHLCKLLTSVFKGATRGGLRGLKPPLSQVKVEKSLEVFKK